MADPDLHRLRAQAVQRYWQQTQQRCLTPDRYHLGTRQLTGRWQVQAPDRGVVGHGVPVTAAKLTPGQRVIAQCRTAPGQFAIDQRSPSPAESPLVDRCVGYFRDQIFTCKVPKPPPKTVELGWCYVQEIAQPTPIGCPTPRYPPGVTPSPPPYLNPDGTSDTEDPNQIVQIYAATAIGSGNWLPGFSFEPSAWVQRNATPHPYDWWQNAYPPYGDLAFGHPEAQALGIRYLRGGASLPCPIALPVFNSGAYYVYTRDRYDLAWWEISFGSPARAVSVMLAYTIGAGPPPDATIYNPDHFVTPAPSTSFTVPWQLVYDGRPAPPSLPPGPPNPPYLGPIHYAKVRRSVTGIGLGESSVGL
jgi:hypothetical protein